jgi:two-component system sensor histidine kinase DegS
LVVLITILFYAIQRIFKGADGTPLHHLLPILFAFPIFYAHLNAGHKFAYIVSFTAVALPLPDIFLMSVPNEPQTWPLEVAQLSVGVILGLTLGFQHDRFEARLKRQNQIITESNVQLMAMTRQAQDAMSRAQELSSNLSALNRQVRQLQEEERHEIARELHDTIAQSLIILCRDIDYIATIPRLPRTAKEPLRDLRSSADTVLADVRRFSSSLRPSALDHLGVVAASEGLARELMRREAIKVNVGVAGQPRRFTSEAELAIFRIVQEALNNVDRHSEATAATVGFTFEDSQLRVDVHDNGKGFDPPADLKSLAGLGHFGLAGMQERAELLGATIDVRSGADVGTSLTLTLDYSKIIPV